MRKRIGILGGSFDPIHKGHLEMAKVAKKAAKLNEVWFMPCQKSPLKEHSLTDFEQREAMVRRAIRGFRRFHCCTLEKELPQPSYTIETVHILKKKYPQFEFVWILGQDQAEKLEKWKEIEQLQTMIEFVCLERQTDGMSETIGQITEKLPNLKMMRVPFHHPASSSLVRQGKFHYCPPAVIRFMHQHGLYLEEIVRAHCKPKRADHSLSVAQVCAELAKLHHVSVLEAYQAGMLHDVCKNLDFEEAKRQMQILYPELLDQAPPLWHSYLATSFCRHQLQLKNKRVLEAIYHHVLGDDEQPLSMILYVADKLDPSRDYDSSTTLERCRHDLKQGFIQVHKEQQAYLLREGIHV